MAETLEEKATQGDVFPIGDLDPDPLADVVDVGLPVDEPPGVVDPDDAGLLDFVELVVQVAHQRLEEVLDGQHSGHAAVLVHDDGDGTALFAHVGQRLQDAERLGEQVGLADLA